VTFAVPSESISVSRVQGEPAAMVAKAATFFRQIVKIVVSPCPYDVPLRVSIVLLIEVEAVSSFIIGIWIRVLVAPD
jgi:hypothetical protein